MNNSLEIHYIPWSSFLFDWFHFFFRAFDIDLKFELLRKKVEKNVNPIPFYSFIRCCCFGWIRNVYSNKIDVSVFSI